MTLIGVGTYLSAVLALGIGPRGQSNNQLIVVAHFAACTQASVKPGGLWEQVSTKEGTDVTPTYPACPALLQNAGLVTSLNFGGNSLSNGDIGCRSGNGSRKGSESHEESQENGEKGKAEHFG